MGSSWGGEPDEPVDAVLPRLDAVDAVLSGLPAGAADVRRQHVQRVFAAAQDRLRGHI